MCVYFFQTCPLHLKNVTVLPCEVQLYDCLPKSEDFEKHLAIMKSSYLNFKQPVSKELPKVTIICIDTPALFLILIYHHETRCL